MLPEEEGIASPELREWAYNHSIKKIEVTSPELAVQHRFLGSPSIRIDGRDIEGREEESEYGGYIGGQFDLGSAGFVSVEYVTTGEAWGVGIGLTRMF